MELWPSHPAKWRKELVPLRKMSGNVKHLDVKVGSAADRAGY
jgi:hypothetical protein